jgi:sulfite exporter TauE/SafE
MIQINAAPHRKAQPWRMIEGLQWLGALCSSDSALRGGLLVGLFLAGAAGSVVHCAPMCGAFVLGQVSDRMARLPAARLCERQRIGNGALLPYHAGRLTTYAGLGTFAASSASALGRVPWFGMVSSVLLTAAALLFLAHAVQRTFLPAGGALSRLDRPWLHLAPRGVGGLVRRTTSSLPHGSAHGEFLTGLALGFLPCGLLYGALLAAAASARPAMGAAAMLVFGLGTVPSLVLVGIAGQAAGRRWQRGVSVAAPTLMGLNAMVLLVLAWQRLA